METGKPVGECILDHRKHYSGYSINSDLLRLKYCSILGQSVSSSLSSLSLSKTMMVEEADELVIKHGLWNFDEKPTLRGIKD